MVIIQIAQLVLSLTILVFVHELGHFLSAKMFGIKVDKFYIFFDAWGKKIFSFKRGGTEYGMGWLPLGGYVKIAGMIDESMDKEQMKKEPEPWEFRSKPNWQKFIVMIAGIVMNIILGVIIYCVYLLQYDKSYTPVAEINKDGIYAWQLGRDAGFKTGDKLIAVDGKEYKRFDDFVSMKVFFGAKVTVNRNGKDTVLNIPNNFFQKVKSGGDGFIEAKNIIRVDSFPVNNNPGYAQKAGLQIGDEIVQAESDNLFSFGDFKERVAQHKSDSVQIGVMRNNALKSYTVAVDTAGRIGVALSATLPPDYDSTNYTVGSAFTFGTRDAFEIFYFQAVGVWKLITGQVKATESIQSPIGITQYFPKTWDWRAFWRMTALLSMVLAFMNLLPIPALDGGHILFIGIETVTRKKLSVKFLERAQVVGMVLLLMLMVFAVGNDIFKIFK